MKSKKTLFNSIFAKYYTATAVLIVLSFLLTSMVQVVFARRYWIEEKREVLEGQTESIVTLLRENVVEYYPGSFLLSEEVGRTLSHLATSGDYNVLITDSSFRVQLCSHASCTHLDAVLPLPTQEALSAGEYFAVTRLGEMYEEEQYAVGQALVVGGNTRLGYVVVSSSAAALRQVIFDNLRTYVLSAVAVLMMAFIVLYLITYRLVRPLRQMAAITRQFSQGDFSARAPVNGRDEVAELGAALNGMAVSLSSLEDMRRSFVANVSHDLKTPMTTITGFIDGILDGTIPPERQTEYLTVVTAETKRLSRLVTAMLDLSRIDSGQLKLTPTAFDLTAMVCATLLSFEQRIEGKRIRVTGLEDCVPQAVFGDYDLLQQVVYNLLDNAVKFTNEDGTLRLTLTAMGGRTVLSVYNTGDGIPAAELPHIFERFYKSDRSRSLDTTGTGLGLYIVRTLVELHGGDISVRSTEGEYSEFICSLPSGILQKK